MARVKINRGNPAKSFLGMIPDGYLEQETPDTCMYAFGNEDVMGKAVSKTIEDQTSGQEREKGARSGRPRTTGTV